MRPEDNIVGSEIEDSRLLLPADADSVARARHHVVAVLGASGLDPDAVDVAQLLVSEVVTNALLHAGTEIEVRCVIDGPCARVAVADGSPNRPALREQDATATTGRGLGLVEALASRWGVQEQAGGGKSVWFELGESDTVATPTVDLRRPAETLRVCFVKLPVEMVRTTISYSEASLREMALIALEEDRQWSPPALDLGPLLEQLADAAARVQAHVDLVVDFPRGSDEAALARLALVDESDALARAGATLTPPAVPEVTACRRWLYRQIALQAGGMEPEPWTLPRSLPASVDAADLSSVDLAALAPNDVALVVADDANRILHANQAAAELLGWDAEDLVSRRLITIIPVEHREAHLAGFARHQLTGEARVIGTSVTVPALRRDNSRVLIRLELRRLPVSGGRTVFAATLRPIDDA